MIEEMADEAEALEAKETMRKYLERYSSRKFLFIFKCFGVKKAQK